MRAFVRGDDRSVAVAGEIETLLDELKGESAPYGELVLALASYRPEGGPFLYGEAEMVAMVSRAVEVLESETE